MSLQFTVCGYDSIEVPPATPTSPPVLTPTTTGGWTGTEPDGSPLGDPLRATCGTTFIATTSLGVAYPPGAGLSATVEVNNSGIKSVVTVPHVEWLNPQAGQLLVRMSPTQMPPAFADNPGYLQMGVSHYRLVVRVIANGVTHVVRDSMLCVAAAAVVPTETA